MVQKHGPEMYVSFSKVDWNDRLLAWFEEPNSSNSNTKALLNTLYVFEDKEFAMQTLLHINEEFDDDLLQDALGLLPYM